MKKTLILLYISSFIITSCNNLSTQKKAEKNITSYLLKYMNDPKSYESVEFSKLDTSLVNDYSYYLEHMYRGKNKLGALTVSKDVFLLDSGLNVKSFVSSDDFSKSFSVSAAQDAAVFSIDSAKAVADSTIRAVDSMFNSLKN